MSQWIDDYYADVDAGNLDGFLNRHAPDASVVFGNNPPAVGRAAIRAAIGGLFAAVSLMRHEKHNVWPVGDGKSAVVELSVLYRTHGGAEVRLASVALLDRDDAGLVTSLRVFTDLAPLYTVIEAEKASQTHTWDPHAELHSLETSAHGDMAAPYAELLGRCPVARIRVDGSKVNWWGAFSHAEMVEAARAHQTLSSTTPSSGPAIIPLQADPPLHGKYRKALNPHFTREMIDRLEPDIRRYAREMISDLVSRGSADLAQDFAFPFPTRVLCRFLGVPDDQWTFHHEFIADVDRSTGHGLNDPDDPVPDRLFATILPRLRELIEDHRRNPREDVVSGILAGDFEEPEILNLILTIMFAGHITTTSGLGNTLLRLARDTELQDYLRANSHRIPDAIEESLRIDTPQQAMPRKALVDVELGGETIRAGELILLNFASANLDPKVWPDAGRFDLDRADKRHVAFGRGLHQCIGQNLARLELRIALEEILAATSSFSISGDIARRTWPLLCVNHLPTSLQPVAASAVR
ncbi:cytochrome P450 [Amycolatopsis pithecellobii]|uniref:Cytochrome P450 n=1 Tax=Amycolatopsis pithecellobii TaxID=664692 RepID=A0A6N7Z2U1_9PSEU|nr:cytochrome P450 [Amycolatopsis pithecellobii]MTD56073.1 cytochrome P450 [Amycolatopsis pithecellobii]